MSAKELEHYYFLLFHTTTSKNLDSLIVQPTEGLVCDC